MEFFGNNWLVAWLVDNPVFSEKKRWIWRYSQKSLQTSPKSDTDIFLKNRLNDFFRFWPEVSTKYDFQLE